jgi:hypothetical protein
MLDVNIHDTDLVSIKSDVKCFLRSNIKVIAQQYAKIYLYVSCRDYNIDYTLHSVILKKQFGEERFIFEVNVNEFYESSINDIFYLFEDYQHWVLCFRETEITDFRLFERGFSNNEFTFYKSLEDDVVWVNKPNISNEIQTFIIPD